ncbi:uncharacterized protein LOC133533056 [Cydia pomonella]|uniref:uncharacterized protein LOC133533056 n=1 Tax=Cydia pomonella TaxID=82600 RepID=UPI002ADE0B74|nr:uncharacterized protein LOC133533056 [Cydia pomonella]
MSNKMGTLRVPDRGSKELGTYCRSCLLEGDIEDYYTLSKLSVTSDNILCLLGECPEPITCNDPLYNLRRETVNGFIVMNYLRVSYSSYMMSLMDFNHGASMMTLHSPIPLTLSVTTRGIGMSICHLVYAASSYKAIPMPDIYALYRLCLGLLEVKLSQDMYTPAHVTDTYRYLSNADLNHIAQSVWVPKQIQCLINAVGKMQHEGITYVPAVAKDVTDDAGAVPRPENLLLSNLRRAVELLSGPATLVQHRKYFYEHNPIPGALWDNEKYLLLNADQIIPADYETNLVTNFKRDCEAIQPYLKSLCRYSIQMPGFACGGVDLKSNGKKFLLISNQIGKVWRSNQTGKLKVPDRGTNEDLGTYCKKCHPEGDIASYYALSKLSGYEVLLGTTSLLGERPEGARFNTDPVYDLRSETITGFRSISLSYKQVSGLIYAYC